MRKFLSCCIQLLGTSEIRTSLFKSGFILITALFISMGTIGPELYDRDLDARKLKFETEFSIKQSITADIDCSILKSHQVECNTVQYQLIALTGATKLWIIFADITLWFGVTFMMLGAIGFFIPFYKKVPLRVL